MGEVPADVFEDIQKDVRDMEGCFGLDLRWVDCDEHKERCILGANFGQGPARQAALGAGIPNTVVSTSVNKTENEEDVSNLLDNLGFRDKHQFVGPRAIENDFASWSSKLWKDNSVVGPGWTPWTSFAGKISYNGHGLKECVPQTTSAYVSQQDWHVAEMTVKETLDLSARCQGVGFKYGHCRFTLFCQSLIASGMLKRSTAMTNSNIQSRYMANAQLCFINIRCDFDYLDEDQSCTAILTIIDIAGAEREKRTGNQVQIIIAFSSVISHISLNIWNCI
ncbi:hypothetical protein L1987_22888 [Smallanthus sonchifolius]|uniref:Uncharacterized protein n=1 Tax=Smallanthus sonchifolius TaxID=185202 RepID=A0ACB9IH14_9ASTR|nr:hypothetical protein L1987_22888 [Smallanthus sonchifolius]